jgi:hypothetical protein
MMFFIIPDNFYFVMVGLDPAIYQSAVGAH